MTQESDYYARAKRYFTVFAKMQECSLAVELKITKGPSLPFDCLAPHQEAYMLESEDAYAYKPPDVGVSQKPYDILVLYRARALLVAIYYVPRETKIYAIPLRLFIKERHRSKRKSLTRTRAAEIGVEISL